MQVGEGVVGASQSEKTAASTAVCTRRVHQAGSRLGVLRVKGIVLGLRLRVISKPDARKGFRAL